MTNELEERLKRISEHATDREDRYRCLQCRDTGYVTLWKPTTIQKAVKDVDAMGPNDWDICYALCTCETADKKSSVFPDNDSPLANKRVPVFGDQPWHIPVRGPDDVEAKAAAALYQHKHENHNDAFDAFA